jgi:nucleotide-binding universal stress UspA family protein
MKTLTFLIDEIDNSKELIRFAAFLGKDINAKVHVLHVQNPEDYGTYGRAGMSTPSDPMLFQELSDDLKEKVAGYIKEIGAELSGFPTIEFTSEIGNASALLKEKVEDNSYDMVMLQGNAEQNSWFQDSVIMDIVNNVPCPVWIVPTDAKYQSLNKIIYATDYNEEDIATLESLSIVAKPLEPEILALHISNDGEFEKKLKNEGFAAMLGKRTGYSKISVKIIAEEDGKDAVEILVNEAEKANANLIVVLKENRNFFLRIFKSSFTADLIKKAQLPVLVYQVKK